MPDLHELEAGRARLVVPFRSLEIVVEYHPDRVSGRTMAALRRAQVDNDPSAIFAEVGQLLAAWDLTRDGEPIPITEDGVQSVGALVTLAIVMAILGDFADPKSRVTTAVGASSPSSRPSALTSSLEDDWATAQSTPGSSLTLAGLESSPGPSAALPRRRVS